MQQDENEGKPMAREKDDNDNSKLEIDDDEGAGFKVDEDDVMDGAAATYEDDELPENLSLALSQWASKLCLVCRRFFEGKIYHAFSGGETYMFHNSMSSLRSSVLSGCPLCKQLSEWLDNNYRMDDLGTLRKPGSIKCTFFHSYGSFLQSQSKADSLIFAFRLFDDDDCMIERHDVHGLKPFLLYSVRGLGDLGPEFLDCTLKTSTARSEASVNLVRSWHRQCTCRRWQPNPRVLPTRLVRVWSPHQGSTDIRANLCETDSLPVTTPYVTLSHRWGPSDFLKLQKSNQRAWHQAVPTDGLLNVFKDAMYIAVELGIHYVWIDSLCIIQDCQNDWTRESRRMGDVYRYGEFNIAATGYDNGEPGLFSMRDAIPSKHFPVYLNFKLAGIYADYNFNGFYINANELGFRKFIVDSPLNSRGWVAQERTLSPAIVHYTPKEVWWECSDMIANETMPSGLENWNREPRWSTGQIRSLEGVGKEEIHDFWRRFIRFFANTKLTLDKDRLPAVAGIARILSDMLNEKYIAGVWENDIARSLVWACRSDISIPSTQLVPSWSWASVCGNIMGIHFQPRSSAQVLSCVEIEALFEVDGISSDLEQTSLERSSVRALSIRGPLRELPTDLYVRDGEGNKPVSWIDVREDKNHIIPWVEAGGKVADEYAWRLNGSTHLLLLAKNRYVVSGLLLQHVPEAQESNTFRRSGLVEFYYRDLERLEEYLGILQKDGQYQPSLRFAESGVQDVILI